MFSFSSLASNDPPGPEPQQPKAKVAKMATSVNTGAMDPYTQCSKYKLILSEQEKIVAENELGNPQNSREDANRYDIYLRTRDYQRTFIGVPNFEIKHFLEKFDYLNDVSLHNFILLCFHSCKMSDQIFFSRFCS